MRTWLVLILITLVPTQVWGRTLARARSRAAVPRGLSEAERLLPTPPVIIRFGWGTSDLEQLVARLEASTDPQLVIADGPGILEYACSPNSIIPWGTPLFRIYEVGLLSDLQRAEESAARIGDRPFIVAPRRFPSPMRQSGRLALPPPTLSSTHEARRASVEPSSTPIVRMPRSPDPTPAPASSPPPPAPKPRAKRASLKLASKRLSAAEERVGSMKALLTAARGDLRAAEQNVVPFKDDVEARRRLADSGVIARNDVKAAEERLREAEAVAAAARARVTEAQSALSAAEAERDAALSGVDKAKSAPQPNISPPPATVAAPRPSRPEPTPAPRPRVQPRRGAVSAAPADDFPAPLVGPADSRAPEFPPLPAETIRLRPRGDMPADGDWGPLPLPEGSTELARQRWQDHAAAWQCVVSRALLPQGARVEESTPVLELRQTAVARLRGEVGEPYVGFCRVGAPVEVAFPTIGSIYRGWISRAEPTRPPRPAGAAIEILLTHGRAGDREVYPALEWMALTAPVRSGSREPLAYEPPPRAQRAPTDLAELFPLPRAVDLDPQPIPPADGRLSGSLELISSKRPTGFYASDPVARKKLERLKKWRRSFIEGMRATVFPETGLTLTYPRQGETSRAVERMATRRVSNVPNRCARTLAEALGWGLGDAAMWAERLPERGYELREDGIARPGDILVWPFTYGPRRSQHVGIAVAQGGTMMLLSNEGGVLGTTALNGGYMAFHKPAPRPKPPAAKKPETTESGAEPTAST